MSIHPGVFFPSLIVCYISVISLWENTSFAWPNKSIWGGWDWSYLPVVTSLKSLRYKFAQWVPRLTLQIYPIKFKGTLWPRGYQSWPQSLSLSPFVTNHPFSGRRKNNFYLSHNAQASRAEDQNNTRSVFLVNRYFSWVLKILISCFFSVISVLEVPTARIFGEST